jgi:hypothetical protein
MTKEPAEDPIEVPEAVARLYDQWHDQHQRTGKIPARAGCGRSARGDEVWCDLEKCGPDELREVRQYQRGAIAAKLKQYCREPSPELAKAIARHLVLADVAAQLLEWALEGKPARLEPADGPTPPLAADDVLKQAFGAAYQALLDDGGAGEEQAWERFRQSPQAAEAAALAAELLAQDLPAAKPELRILLQTRLRPVFDKAWEWAVSELCDEVRHEPGNGLRCWYEPRADGTVDRWFVSDDAPSPGKPSGRPEENEATLSRPAHGPRGGG